MSFTVRIPVANIAAANAALAAQGHGDGNFSVPIWTSGPMPAFAALEHIGNDAVFQAHCAALPGAVVRVAGQLAPGMDATAVAAGGRWGANAPLLQGNVTPGLYRAIPADGGALWWVIQAFNRTVFGAALATYPALVRRARVPGEVAPWAQPLDQFDAYQSVNPFTGLPDQVTHGGKTWNCLTADNSATPGVSGWREDGAYPAWAQPTGAHDAYPLNALVSHLGVNYRSTIPANTTVPGENVVFGWWVVV